LAGRDDPDPEGKAANAVLAEWLRLRRLRELKALQGTLDIAYPVADFRHFAALRLA
jgi:hypothetical protein